MTPEESLGAPLDALSKQRIGEEMADVLLYLLQVADHTRIDVAQAVAGKLARNAVKYPARREIAAASSGTPLPAETHILLDHENVQPTEVELRAMAPEATRVWVFHGPQQKQVAQRFASHGHARARPAPKRVVRKAAAKKAPAMNSPAKKAAVKTPQAQSLVATEAGKADPSVTAAAGQSPSHPVSCAAPASSIVAGPAAEDDRQPAEDGRQAARQAGLAAPRTQAAAGRGGIG